MIPLSINRTASIHISRKICGRLTELNTRWADELVLGLLLVIVPLCYAPVWLTSYGFSDDYALLAAAPQGNMDVERDMKIAQGRPIIALLISLFFSQMDAIADLRYLRLLGVIGVSLVAWSVYRALRRAGWDKVLSCASAVVMCTLPPFQVYTSWTVTAFFPFAALASGAALLLAEKAFHARRPLAKWGLALGACLLLLVALTIFQPAAMFYWVFAAIVLFRPDASTSAVLSRFFWFSGIAAVALLLGFGVYKYGAAMYPLLLPPTRSQLVQDFGEKTLWFFRLPLMNALNLMQLFPKRDLARGVAVFLISGLILYWRGDLRNRLIKLCVALTLIPLCYLPNLVIAESWPSYRSQAALTSIILVYVLYALWGYGHLLLRSAVAVVLPIVLSFVAVGSCVLAAYNVSAYFAHPQRLELQAMRDRLSQQDLSAVRSIYIIGSHAHNSLAPGFRYDEFGLPSSSQPWGPGAMVYLLLREVNPKRATIPITLVPADGPVAPPEDALVINMPQLLETLKGGEERSLERFLCLLPCRHCGPSHAHTRPLVKGM